MWMYCATRLIVVKNMDCNREESQGKDAGFGGTEG